jgi:hypothetical protein
LFYPEAALISFAAEARLLPDGKAVGKIFLSGKPLKKKRGRPVLFLVGYRPPCPDFGHIPFLFCLWEA